MIEAALSGDWNASQCSRCPFKTPLYADAAQDWKFRILLLRITPRAPEITRVSSFFHAVCLYEPYHCICVVKEERKAHLCPQYVAEV